MWHDSFICGTWLIHTCDTTQLYVIWRLSMSRIASFICDMTHSYVWHNAFICVTQHIHIWHHSGVISHINVLCHTYEWVMSHVNEANAPEYVTRCLIPMWHDSFICVTRHIHMRYDASFICDMMPYSYVMPHSYVTWLIHIWHMTHSYVWHNTFIRDMTPHSYVTWCLIHTWCLIRMWLDSFTYGTWLIHMCETTHSYEWVVSHNTIICDMTQSYVWHDPLICMSRVTYYDYM